MAENYKHLYEQTKKMLTMYQDELIPGYRKQIEDLEAKSKWIPVTERLPEEHESIFAMLYGTKRWEPAMFRTTSDDVLAVVKFKDGKRAVKTVRTTDGEWRLLNIFGARDVTHWMPLPEPPKEVE